MIGPYNIAVDGPAGVGKSTVGKLLAERHGYLFLDTGVLYRVVGLLALREGVAPGDEEGLASLARGLDIELVRTEPGSPQLYRVLLGGEDVTAELRGADVERRVSEIAAHPQVRAALLDRQREIARRSPSVLVGRDIGTVVLPEAELKIYLEASLSERALRRHRELLGRGAAASFAQVTEELKRRDRLDSERTSAPLRVPDDAYVVDTNGKAIEAVLEEIEAKLTLGETGVR